MWPLHMMMVHGSIDDYKWITGVILYFFENQVCLIDLFVIDGEKDFNLVIDV